MSSFPNLGRSSLFAAASALLLSSWNSRAVAQDADSAADRPPVDSDASSAGARTLLAQPGGDQAKKATDAFKKGKKLFDDRKYIPALAEFQMSYNLVPSPNSGLYIARCFAELGQHKEAYFQFKRVITEADMRARTEPKYGPTRDSARNEIEDVSKKLSLLTVQVQNPAANTTLRVGAMAIARDQWGTPIPLDPGGVDVVLETPGTPAVQNRVELQRGEKKTIAIGPQQAGVILPPPPRPTQDDGGLGLLPVAIAFGGVGVAGFIAFGVAGGLSLSTYSEVEDTCSTLPAAECNDLIDTGETQQLVANIGWIVGAVGLAAGATILIVDLTSGGGSGGTREAASVDLHVGPGHVGVRGAF